VTYKECGAEGHTFLAIEVRNLLLEVTIAFLSLKVALKRVKLSKYIQSVKCANVTSKGQKRGSNRKERRVKEERKPYSDKSQMRKIKRELWVEKLK
jgi:hypothetical protein